VKTKLSPALVFNGFLVYLIALFKCAVYVAWNYTMISERRIGKYVGVMVVILGQYLEICLD
jgi:hypothetical protein